MGHPNNSTPFPQRKWTPSDITSEPYSQTSACIAPQRGLSNAKHCWVNPQVVCVLLSDQPDGAKNPLGYWSQMLNSVEQSNATTQRNLLDILLAIILLRHYLEVQKINNPYLPRCPQMLLNPAASTERIGRWRVCLPELNFEVVHRTGGKDQGAQELSLVETDGAHETVLDVREGDISKQLGSLV